MSACSLEKLLFINDHLNPNLRVMHADFLRIMEISQIYFARNIYGRNDNWRFRPDYKFNFTYANSNKSTDIFQNIRSELNKYCNKFFFKRKSISSEPEKKEFSQLDIKMYENFIKTSMSDIINNVCNIFTCNFVDYIRIVSQYNHLKINKKSSKINYEVLKQLNI